MTNELGPDAVATAIEALVGDLLESKISAKDSATNGHAQAEPATSDPVIAAAHAAVDEILGFLSSGSSDVASPDEIGRGLASLLARVSETIAAHACVNEFDDDDAVRHADLVHALFSFKTGDAVAGWVDLSETWQ